MNHPARESRHRLRHALAWVHRYSGLSVALLLVCAGVTGSILAWNEELERVFAPGLFVVPRHPPDAPVLDPFVLRDIAARRFPTARIDELPLRLRADAPADFPLEYPATSGGGGAPDDHVFLDPVTGGVLGTRRDGDLRQGAKNIMPFIDALHEELMLGDIGRWVLGIASLLWVLQCFSGVYLSFPLRRAAPPGGGVSWWSRWRPSWRIRTYGDVRKVLFDVHRAGSLWSWAVLSMYAWSALSFNLPVVYGPVVGLLGYESPLDAIADTRDASRPPALSWRDAHAVAVRALTDLSAVRHFSLLSERLMMYRRDKHVYEYRVQTSKDVEARGNSRLFIDADTGTVLGFELPTGGRFGNSLTAWIEALHEGMVFGVWYRVCVSVFGGLIALLSAAGALLWIRKKRRVTRPVSIRAGR